MKLHEIPAEIDGGFHVVVESPRGARIKMKYEPELGVLSGGRALPLGHVYPYDWGFVPGTKAHDGDPADALVYWDVPSYPGVVLNAGRSACSSSIRRRRAAGGCGTIASWRSRSATAAATT
jgi:inorganic pyrophosphatase